MITTVDGTVVNPQTGEITDVQSLIAQIAAEEGIPPEIALAVAQQESGFNPYAVGDGGHSHGLYQENDAGRGAGRDPDYDVVGQVRRFAADYRNAAAANPGADMATLAYLAQRPADRQGYINSLNGILGVGGGGSKLAAPMPDAFKPKGPIKAVQIFGNQVQVTYQDDAITSDLVDLASWEAFTGVKYDPTTGKPAANQPASTSNAITPYQQATLGQSSANAAQSSSQFNQNLGLNYAQLTEDQRQYNESQGVDKAKFNITQQFNEAVQKWREAIDARDYETAQFWAKRADEFNVQQTEAANANRDVTRGQTLLGLGSRPETLGRYLYAVQGQQAPQGFDFGTSALPGFGPNAQNPTVVPLGGAAGAGIPGGLPGMGGGVPGSGVPAIGAPAAGGVLADPRVTAVKQAIATPGSDLSSFVAPGGTTITPGPGHAIPAPQYTTPPPTQVLQAGAPATATQLPTSAQITAQDALIAQGRVPRFYSNGVAIFGKGGVIPEPVIGRGLLSGQEYVFGEQGPETVRPTKKGDKQPKGDGTYATGGVIGANAQGTAGWWDPGDATHPPVFHPGPMPSVMQPAQTASIGGNPTQAQTAMIGGVNTWAGGLYSGQPVGSTPANAGNLTPYLQNPALPAPVGATSPNPIQPVAPPAVAPAVPGASLAGLANVPGNTGGMRGMATESRSVFNPGQLGQYLSGQFLRPGIPNFPQYQQATGGTSLLSNARWLSQATPSEVGLYKGFLQDEAGVPPEDVLALAGRMAPQGGSLRTPGYGRTY